MSCTARDDLAEAAGRIVTTFDLQLQGWQELVRAWVDCVWALGLLTCGARVPAAPARPVRIAVAPWQVRRMRADASS